MGFASDSHFCDFRANPNLGIRMFELGFAWDSYVRVGIRMGFAFAFGDLQANLKIRTSINSMGLTVQILGFAHH